MRREDQTCVEISPHRRGDAVRRQRRRRGRRAAAFMREYAEHAGGPTMPRRVGEYTCRIHYWRNDDGDVYASRHTCTRGRATVRFYGMV